MDERAAEVSARMDQHEKTGGVVDAKVMRQMIRESAGVRGIAATDTEDWMKQFKSSSLVNYASAPIGAKKYDASTLSR